MTSEAYWKWLNGKLGIDVDYTLLHDVYHDYYEHPELKESGLRRNTSTRDNGSERMRRTGAVSSAIIWRMMMSGGRRLGLSTGF